MATVCSADVRTAENTALATADAFRDPISICCQAVKLRRLLGATSGIGIFYRLKATSFGVKSIE
jgi:hypothetical protein